MKRMGLPALVGLVAIAAAVQLSADTRAVDAAFDRFWRASSPTEAAEFIGAVVKSGVGFEEAVSRLKKGRHYSSDVPRGIVRLSHRRGDTEFPYTLDIPQSYDAATKYQVRVQLHGGVNRLDAAPRGNGIGTLAGIEQIYILPTAWAAAEWWTDRQLDNLRTILDSVKRSYNVDENRIVLSGVSDGGTGAYYFAMRDTTPFAAFLPLNGAIPVLRSSSVIVDGELFPQNFLNKPFFIVNGGRDPLYPTSLVEPYIQQMIKGGTTVKYLPQPEAVHNTAWWPDVKDAFEGFVREHPRNPVPERITWESDLTAGTNRAQWLVIDRLAPAKAEKTPLPDLNDLVLPPVPNFGIRSTGTRILAVTAGSNAERFGLKAGDTIVRINQRTIPAPVDVLDLLSVYDAGEQLTIVVARDNQQVELRGEFNPVSTPRVVPMFPHGRPSGRVDLVRDGNTVAATTRGVGAFTLLLPADAYDFSKPLKVVVDGQTVFNSRVTTSLATLLTWAARDNDRTFLVGAEVQVTVP